MIDKLYSINDAEPETFGTYVAKDGTRIVLKVNDTYQAFDKSQITEVKPFTISVTFEPSGKDYHYMIEDSSNYAVGDMLIRDEPNFEYTLVKVTGIDTKSDRATKYFIGYKIARG